jgi:hypothetical protein
MCCPRQRLVRRKRRKTLTSGSSWGISACSLNQIGPNRISTNFIRNLEEACWETPRLPTLVKQFIPKSSSGIILNSWGRWPWRSTEMTLLQLRWITYYKDTIPSPMRHWVGWWNLYLSTITMRGYCFVISKLSRKRTARTLQFRVLSRSWSAASKCTRLLNRSSWSSHC